MTLYDTIKQGISKTREFLIDRYLSYATRPTKEQRIRLKWMRNEGIVRKLILEKYEEFAKTKNRCLVNLLSLETGNRDVALSGDFKEFQDLASGLPVADKKTGTMELGRLIEKYERDNTTYNNLVGLIKGSPYFAEQTTRK